MKYSVLILPRAERELDSLPAEHVERIDNAIGALGDDPRPHNCKKLKDHDAWRIRVGNYRVVYEINDAERVVVVIHVGHRREVYR